MSKRYSSKKGFLKFSFFPFIQLTPLKTLNSDFTYEVEIIKADSIDFDEIKAKKMCEERDLYFDRFRVGTNLIVLLHIYCISTIEGFECSILFNQAG